MIRIWRRIGAIVVNHPVRVLVGALVAIGLLAIGLPRLEFVTDQATMVNKSSDVYRNNARFQDNFGGEPMLVLLTGDLGDLTSPEALDRFAALEEELRATGEFDAVIGPAAAMEFAAAQLTVAPDMFAEANQRDTTAAADEARADVAAQGGTQAAQEEAAAHAAAVVATEREAALAAETSRAMLAGEQSLDNPAFIDFLLYDTQGQIRPALQDVFLDQGHGLLMVRLHGNASIEEQANGAQVVKDIVAKHDIPGVEMLASGPPVLLSEINDYLQGGMATLGAIAVGVMALLLLIVFRARWRLLPLVIVLVGAMGAFGAIGWFDIPLTLVTISGLPILIGLGVDFAIQMHNRYEEEHERPSPVPSAVRETFVRMGPPLALAMLAAVAGFLALQRSQVPMIRDFGSLLSVGVVVLVLAGLAIVVPILSLRDRRRPTEPRDRGRTVERAVRAVSSLPGRAAVPLVLLGAAVLGAGLAVEGGLPIQTDPEKWIDQEGDAVTELKALREGTGFSSELSILVEAPDVTAPEVAAWMGDFGAEEVRRHSELLRDTSMPALANGIHGTTPGGNDIPALLSVAPDDVAKAMISSDHTAASLVFPIAPVSLSQRERLLDEITADIEGDLAPPSGVHATPAGLAALGVELVNGLEAGRRTLSLTALGLVLLWLIVAQRAFTRSVLILVPVAIAVGLSSVAIDLLGIELTPLTTVAGPLVIAVGTEFSVLLVARYIEEREAGLGPRRAVSGGVTRIGRAFVASGLTLVGGFSVLAFSPMPLLRDFGIVVALDVLFALASTLVLLPPLLVWADGQTWLRGFCPGEPEHERPEGETELAA